ncbi:MAG: CcmD family protein [Deltaproteobacteria bacterium]|nr:CcmD family protein [Deltaproteobacteria bacterium]
MESIPNTQFDLFLGYTAIWALIAGYLWFLRREQTKLRRELEELKR